MLTDIQRKKYYNSLQGLRFVLFLNVFLFHILGIIGKRTLFGKWFEYSGRLGVSGFLALSGFLFAISTLGRNDLSVSYSIKRYIKKYYPYHFLLFISFIPFELLSVFEGNQNLGRFLAKAVLQITLTQTMVPISDIYLSFNNVSWYLSTLLLISIFAIPLAGVLKKQNAKTISIVLLLLLVFEYAISLILPNSEFATWLLYISFPIRLIDYVIGMCFGYIFLEKRITIENARKNLIVIAVFSGLVIIPFINSYLPQNLTYCAIYNPLMGLLIMCLADGENILSAFLSKPFMIKLGNISFLLYIFHYAVMRYLWIIWKNLSFVTDSWIWNSVFILLVFIITYAVSKCVLLVKERNQNG